MATLRSASLPGRTTPHASGRPAASPERPRRDPWLDNAKMTLVTLVVVGHAWTLLPHSTGTDWAYDFLYAWHIPAFVLITGYLSRGFTWTGPRLLALVRTVAVPYVLFETALAVFRYQVGGVRLHDLFLDPHWPMWYLAALFFWRLLTPVFTALPRGTALGLAVLVSLVAGLRAGDTFDMARILGLLPFFVLGLHLRTPDWDRLRPARTAWFGLLGLATVAVVTRFTDDWIATEWYYYRSRYDALEPDDLHAMAIRLVLLGIGLLGAVSFLALVPRVRGWFTALGAATLVVYLFHGFVVLSAQYAGYPGWTAAHPVPAFVLTTVAAVAVALVLAAPPVAHRLNVVVDPLGRWHRWHQPADRAPRSD
ncbi:acyltransferase family protein [Marmoricola sp. RAF53]|uniref:acyltransferase family protein n=1 Tax=Marmoricola sp. RAF53 TaxID=3233059 RepID=UPI003F99F0C9